METKRIQGVRKWQPKYWLLNGGDGSIFFINSSESIIDELHYPPMGIFSIDDIDTLSKDEKTNSYKNVLVGEAVKISEYNESINPGIVFQYEVTVIQGDCSTTYRSMPVVDAFREAVLEWR